MADIFTPRVRFFLAVIALVSACLTAGFFTARLAELDRRYAMEDRV